MGVLSRGSGVIGFQEITSTTVRYRGNNRGTGSFHENIRVSLINSKANEHKVIRPPSLEVVIKGLFRNFSIQQVFLFAVSSLRDIERQNSYPGNCILVLAALY